MSAIVQTIPELPIQTQGSQTKVVGMLPYIGGTVPKYNRDSKGECYVIVNGTPMVKQGRRGKP